MWAIISGAGGGIRTPVAQRRQIYSLVVLATHPPLPFDDHIDLLAQMRILIPVKEIDNSFLLSFMWSPGRELNPQPADYKSAALPLRYSGIRISRNQKRTACRPVHRPSIRTRVRQRQHTDRSGRRDVREFMNFGFPNCSQEPTLRIKFRPYDSDHVFATAAPDFPPWRRIDLIER